MRYGRWIVTSALPPGSSREEVALTKLKQNLINHVAFVIDCSGSMRGREADVIKVVDNQVSFLAQLSNDLDQETRVTVYFFDSVVECVFFDKDVLRLPSIADHYFVRGQTALRDATIRSQEELAQTCQLYGDHAFLTFVFTDGHENASFAPSHKLQMLLGSQKDNWTVGVLVPDLNGKLAAKAHGFPEGNISIWNTTSATGVEEAGYEMRAATVSYMQGRAAGVSGTRTLFSTDASAVNAQTIKAAGLKPLSTDKYAIVSVSVPPAGSPVSKKLGETVWQISDFVRSVNGGHFTAGEVFYELHKSERVQGNKRLMVLEKATNKVFSGDGVRGMIGLSDQNQTVMPDFNKDYTIFVQSTSDNRHLKRHTRIIILK